MTHIYTASSIKKACDQAEKDGWNGHNSKAKFRKDHVVDGLYRLTTWTMEVTPKRG